MKVKTIVFCALMAPLSITAETYKLIGQRHLRLYTAPEPTQSYNASIDAQTIADSLCNVPWTHVTSLEATSTTHANEQLDANVANRDRFDAALFCAFHTNGMHTTFANAAVYRYRLPDGTLPNLTALAAKVSSDPYNALGARIVLLTSDAPDIPTDCATVRGDVAGGIRLAGVASRITRKVDEKDYWYPNTTNAVFSVPSYPPSEASSEGGAMRGALSPTGAGTLPAGGLPIRKYLFVFVLMENYSTSRGNWLEGCSWIDNLISVTTDAPVPGWTDGQTVDLSGETGDDPVDAKTRVDTDNDGLTDFRERMASTVLTNLYGTTPVDAAKMATYPGQLVPDYFLPVTSGSSGGWTYLGSLLTDHDFIEDWLEDDETLFFDDRKASRYQYDANKDYDGNGWDNWSEARAFLATDSYCGRPTPTGRIKVVYNGDRAYVGNLVIKAYHYHNGAIPPMTVGDDETWTFPVGRKSAWYDLRSSSDSYLQPGKNMFVVYNDADTDGAWTPGEPYGIVTDVDVGYAKIADSTVEITDVNPSIVRIDLAKALKTSGFETHNALTDRGANGLLYYPNVPIDDSDADFSYDGPLTAPVRVRIVRYAINDTTQWETAGRINHAGEVVVDRYVTPSLVPVLGEWLLLSSDMYDLDMRNLVSRAFDLGWGADFIYSAQYVVLIGEGTPDLVHPEQNNNLSFSFVNAFDEKIEAQKPTNLSIVDKGTARPAFKWFHNGKKNYPAFILQVLSGSTIVANSGSLRSPAKDGAGSYVWQSPWHIGTDLDADTDYTFKVTMVSANRSNYFSDSYTFRLSANGIGGDISDQYSIPTAVKYFGHISTAGKTIRVEAFESPDFIGIPYSVTTVTNNSAIAATDSLVPNALLIGLEANRKFYVRAFLDVDGDGVLDDGEPWGYCNYVGELRRDIYTPRPFSFSKGTTETPKAVVYLEDVDVAPLDLSTVVMED